MSSRIKSRILELIEQRGQEVYKFESDQTAPPLQIKMDNAYKAGYIAALREIKTVVSSITISD